jgi:hypothetical protein
MNSKNTDMENNTNTNMENITDIENNMSSSENNTSNFNYNSSSTSISSSTFSVSSSTPSITSSTTGVGKYIGVDNSTTINSTIITIKVESIYQTLISCEGDIIRTDGMCSDYQSKINYKQVLKCQVDNTTCHEYGLIVNETSTCGDWFKSEQGGGWGPAGGSAAFGYGFCTKWQKIEVKTCLRWGIIITLPATCVQLNAKLTNGTILTSKNCGYVENTQLINECASLFNDTYENWTQVNDYTQYTKLSSSSSTSSTINRYNSSTGENTKSNSNQVSSTSKNYVLSSSSTGESESTTIYTSSAIKNYINIYLVILFSICIHLFVKINN